MNRGFTITAGGVNVLTSLLAGEQLEITKVMVGKGKLAEDQEPADLTELIDPVALATSNTPTMSDQQVNMVVEYRNDLNGGLAEAFYLNEFGVWGKRTGDTDEAVMIYYATLGDYPQWVGPISGGLDVRRYPVAIGLATKDVSVQLNYPAGAFVTAEEFRAALLNKANATETIYYIGDTPATPDTTGFSSLSEYLKDMFRKGFRGVCGPIGNFEELPVQQWGYGVLATPGENGYVWDVEIFRSLTSTRQYRQLSAASGGWIMDDWEEYATKNDLANKADRIITETNEPLDKIREFGWYLIQTPPSGYPPGYTTDSFFALFVSGRDVGWSPWLLMDLRTGSTFRGGYSVGQFMPWVPIATSTPPEKHDLPLAEGISGAVKFSKDQFGKLLIPGIYVTTTRVVVAGETIATLPAEYRLAGPAGLRVLASLGDSLGNLYIDPNGSIMTSAAVASGAVICTGSIAFTAS